MVVNLLELIRVKKAMMQTMKLAFISIFKDRKLKILNKKLKKLEDKIEKLKCLKWVVKKILPTI